MAPPAAASPPRAMAVYDMDRTLLDTRVIKELGDRFGFEEAVMDVIAERDRGTLSQDEVTLAVARFLNGVRVADFDRCVADLPLSPGASGAVRRLQEARLRVAICSDSYTRAVRPLAKRLGVDLFAANVLEERDGVLTGELVPWGPALGFGPSKQVIDKAEALPILARHAGLPLARVAHVGDGDHDARAFPLVGLGISFNGTPTARKAAHHAIEGDLGPSADLVLAWAGKP